jgi:hypothetical protein
MKRVHLAFACAAATVVRAAPAQSVKVSPSTLVAVSPADHAITEPHLAIDPTHPERFVAAVYQASKPGLRFPAGQDEQTCAAFVSGDSGATWTKHEFNTTWCADPWVAITPDGQALVTMLGRHAALPQQGNSGLVAFHSADAGRTWDTLAIGLGRSHDHPTMAVDLGSGPRRGWIYLSSHRGRSADDGRIRYGVYLARSRTGGKSFDDAAYFIPNNLHNLAEIPTVLSDGTLIASFVDAAFFSTDTASAQQKETLFERRRAWVVRSTDGGYTFSTPFFVTDACGPPPGYRLSAFAADVSNGQYGGRLYFACRAAGGGPIVVTASRDRGETWTSPVRMQATSRDSVTYPIPALAVNDRGAVLVAWWGASGDANDACGTNLYASASTDGGKTFSPRALVATCAGGGDYFGLVGVPGGRFRLLWPETRSGVRQLRTTLVEVATGNP